MPSKILPFNKALLRKDWKLIQWVALAFFLILFLAVPFNIARTANEINKAMTGKGNIIQLYNQGMVINLNLGLSFFLMGITGLVFSAMLFGEEKRKKTIEITVSGPYSRQEIFFNKIILGMGTLFAPVIICGLILMGILASNSVLGFYISLSTILEWMFSMISFSAAIFAFVTLVGMLFGSSTGQVICSVIFSLFPMGFYGLFRENLSQWSSTFSIGSINYGSLDNFFGNISPLLYFSSISQYEGVLIYTTGIKLLILTLIMLLVSMLLFDISKMEKNGEILTFQKTESIFRIGVFICSILLGGIVFRSIIAFDPRIGLLLGYAIGGFAGFMIPKYLIEKNRVS